MNPPVSFLRCVRRGARICGIQAGSPIAMAWRVPLFILAIGACGNNIPARGAGAGTGGEGVGSGGAAGAQTGSSTGGAFGSSLKQLSCDDIGAEPVIPDPCATLLAPRTTTAGVPTDESTLDTDMIQQAITDCPGGQAVKLVVDGANNAFLSGPLTLKAGVTLWIDTGVTLFASRDPRVFDVRPGQCGGNGTGNSACFGLINVRNAANTAVVGGGAIDGRGGEVMVGSTLTWWDLEDAYDGQLAAPRLVQVAQGTNLTLYQVTLRNSPKFHVVIENTNGFRVWGITINTPSNAPNTDGVDPSASTNGIIAYNKITTGDDNIAIKGGGPTIVDTLIVAHNHFGRGHGMSIGSETNGGVRNVLVCDLSLDQTDNGLRIKSDSSRGGVVQGITYTDVCMRSVRNPLVFDPYYSSATGTRIPDYRDIVVRNTHVLGGGRIRLVGHDAARPLGLTLDNVTFDTAPTITATDANIALGPEPVNFNPVGAGVTVTTNTTGTAPPRVCDDAWVTF
jgi:polygalacturonase